MLMEFKSIPAFSLHNICLLHFTLRMLLNTVNGIDLITVCYCSWKSYWDLNELMRLGTIIYLFQRSQLLVSGGGGIALL